MNDTLYTIDVLRLAGGLEPPHDLARQDGRAEVRSPTCGSVVETAVMVDHEGRVVDLSQRVSACAFGQAAAALVEAAAKGLRRDDVVRAHRDIADWLSGERPDPGDWPDAEALEPARPKRGRHGAILLPFRALIAALDPRP